MTSRARLNELYHGQSQDAVRFQAIWLVFDILLIGFFVASPFMERGGLYLFFDYAIAAILALDLIARAWSFGSWAAWIRRPIVWADLVVLASLIVPEYAVNLGFLRVLRAYSLVHGKMFNRNKSASVWESVAPTST